MTNPLTKALTELLAALDRRVPRPERRSERSIAADSATLRAQTVTHLALLADASQDGAVQPDTPIDTRRTCARCECAEPEIALLTSMTTYYACGRCGWRWQTARS